MFTLCRNVFWHYTSKQEAKRVAKAKRDKEKKNNPKKFLLIHDTFEEREKKATFESIFEENMFLLSVVLAFQKKLNRMLTSIGPCKSKINLKNSILYISSNFLFIKKIFRWTCFWQFFEENLFLLSLLRLHFKLVLLQKFW